MKKQSLNTLCFVLLLGLISCNKIDDLFKFTISNQSSITIPASVPVNLPIAILTPDIMTNSSQAFSNNNTSVNNVKNIYLKNVNCIVTNPQGQTFNFLRSIHIYISTDSLAEIELAYLDTIPSNTDSITLIPTQAVLDQYVKASGYNLRTAAVIDQELTQDVTINVDSKFQVTANF